MKLVPIRAKKGKPTVAYLSELTAKSNIERKRDLIHLALGERPTAAWITPVLISLASELLKHCPTSPAQFHIWTTAHFPPQLRDVIPHFSPNGPKTLRRIGKLHGQVCLALVAVKTRRNRTQERPTKLESLAAAQKKLNEAKLLKSIAMTELADFRSNAQREIKELSESKMNLANELREVIERNERLAEEIATLRLAAAQISGSNVQPMRPKASYQSRQRT